MGLKRTLRLLRDPELRLRHDYEKRRRACNARRSFPLTPEAILCDIDHEKLEAIRARHSIPNPGIRIEKYLEIDKWLATNIRRILNMGLDFMPGKRILDLGSGAGYFLHLCKRLGHDVLGLDMHDPAAAWYGDMLELLGVQRVIWRIDPFVKLPDLGPRFDYVTAFMVCFNNHASEDVWLVDQWRFFLDDLWTHLNPGAIVWFELNPQLDGTHYSPELRAFFESRGAIVDGKRLVWGMDKTRYDVLLGLAKSETAALRKAAEEAPPPPAGVPAAAPR